MNLKKMCSTVLSCTLTFGLIQTTSHSRLPFQAAAEDQQTDTPVSETVIHRENPFDRQDDTEVLYDRNSWVQPESWNCPTFDPRDYPGYIMLFCDKIGLEPDEARGQTQRIYFSIVGDMEPVSSMKFHIFYDTRLKIKTDGSSEPLKPGKAVSEFTTGSAVIEEGQLAFYAYSPTDIDLQDGCLFTADFIIPENAGPGELYPIGFSYVDDGIAYDMFLNTAMDDASKLQMTYLFTKGLYNGYLRMLGEKPPAVPLKGDYNNDRQITVADAVLLARFLAEQSGLTDEQVAELLNHEPDYDSDGFVTVLDAAGLLAALQADAAAQSDAGMPYYLIQSE